MSEVEGDKVDQITAIPKDNDVETSRVAKVKVPKRVAAGKALTERNRKAREALKEKEAAKVETRKDYSSQFSIDSITKVAALVGAGFTLYHGYTVIKPYLSTKKKESYEMPVTTTLRVAPVKEPEPEKNKVEEKSLRDSTRIQPGRLVEMDME